MRDVTTHWEINQSNDPMCSYERTKEKLFCVQIELSNNEFFSKNPKAIEMKKTQIFMNRPVYLGLSISKKTVM